MTYLDYAAATPLDEQALSAMKPYFSDLFYNPSSGYLQAKKVRDSIEDSRKNVALELGCRPSEIIFTAGGTEANNMAIKGVMAKFPSKKLLISSIEHDSVLASSNQFSSDKILVDQKATILLKDLSQKIDDDTVLISVMYANNEVGTIQPIKDISILIKQTRKDRANRNIKTPIYLHTDACQAANYLDLHVNNLGVDLMTLNGGKIYGPKQSGCLYVKAGVELKNIISGGGQEKNLRSGTENVAGIIGFTKALQLTATLRTEESKRLNLLKQEFIKSLNPEKITINSTAKHSLPNMINISVTNTDGERLLMELDEKGIMCSTGSACSARKDNPSHVLVAMGLSDQQIAGSLRFSMGRQTTMEDVKNCLKVLNQLIN